MLRRICSGCGSVIGGEPIIDKEYADAVLIIDDEIASIYDDLCDGCRGRLKHAVAHAFEHGAEHDARQCHPAAETATDTCDDDGGSERYAHSAPADETGEPHAAHAPYEPVDKDALPNAVTRQFPITLPSDKR